MRINEFYYLFLLPGIVYLASCYGYPLLRYVIETSTVFSPFPGDVFKSNLYFASHWLVAIWHSSRSPSRSLLFNWKNCASCVLIGLLWLDHCARDGVLYDLSSLCGLCPVFCLVHCSAAHAALRIIDDISGRLVRRGRSLSRGLVSHILSECGRPHHDNDDLRNSFRNPVHVSPGDVANHSHGNAAGVRNAGAPSLRATATTMGLNPFIYQMSRRDQLGGADGSREHYWAKDLNAQYRPANYSHDQALIIVDVDYYVDMPGLLLSHEGPVLLHTFTPSAAASNSRQDYRYTFLPNNCVEMTVCGNSAPYSHHIWDYTKDIVTVYSEPSPFWPLTGSGPRFHVYNVERNTVGEDHEHVALIPLKIYTGLPALLARKFVTGMELTRFQPVQCIETKNGAEHWTVFKKQFPVNAECGPKVIVTLGRAGSEACVTIPYEVHETLVNQANNAKTTGLTLSSVKTILSHYKKDPLAAAVTTAGETILQRYYSHKHDSALPTVMPVERASRTFQHYNDFDEQDANPCVHPFCPPILNEGFNPVHSVGNDINCVRERVEIPQSKTRSIPAVTQFVLTAMTQLIERLVPEQEAHMAHPADEEDVWNRQKRRTQRSILEVAMFCLRTLVWVLKCFMKGEVYDGPKAPRNISTVDPHHKLEYSQVCYTAANQLKKFDFYAFGKTPKEVAERVADTLSKTKTGANFNDFSKMDGHINYVCRLLELMFLLRLFVVELAQSIRQMHASGRHREGVTRQGVRFRQGESRASGSPETSVLNTLVCIFMIYLGYAYRFRDQGVLDPWEKAWQELLDKCIAGGDDSSAGDLPDEYIVRSCKSIGMVAKPNFLVRGSLGVNFLARYYGPDVWNGDPTSCVDIRRALGKAHMSTIKDAPAVEKFYQKWKSLSLSDHNTPVFEHVCNALDRLNVQVDVCERVAETESWWTKEYPDLEQQYPNEHQEWMDDLLAAQMPGFRVDFLEQHCARATTLEELMQFPLCWNADDRYSIEAPVDKPVVSDVNPLATPAPTPATGVHDDNDAADIGPASALENIAEENATDPPRSEQEAKDRVARMVAAAAAYSIALRLNKSKQYVPDGTRGTIPCATKLELHRAGAHFFMGSLWPSDFPEEFKNKLGPGDHVYDSETIRREMEPFCQSAGRVKDNIAFVVNHVAAIEQGLNLDAELQANLKKAYEEAAATTETRAVEQSRGADSASSTSGGGQSPKPKGNSGNARPNGKRNGKKPVRRGGKPAVARPKE
uniref:RNA replicase n=1 Tax=Beihai noda-like virus 4 TaxID=1922486 RepID=A0A1L3KFC3_9VIRU|nr:hypothetical protein [Beihai noda-like virus 4]